MWDLMGFTGRPWSTFLPGYIRYARALSRRVWRAQHRRTRFPRELRCGLHQLSRNGAH